MTLLQAARALVKEIERQEKLLMLPGHLLLAADRLAVEILRAEKGE